jgi:hypothetical protein
VNVLASSGYLQREAVVMVARPEGMQFANDFNASLWLAHPRPAIEFVADFLRMASNCGGVK